MAHQTEAKKTGKIRRWITRGLVAVLALILVLPALFYAVFAVVNMLSRPSNPQAAKKRGDALLALKGKTVVAVSAHPDDIDYWASGTMAMLHRNGNKIIMVLGTSGEKGGGGNVPNLGKIREQEQLQAAKAVGYDKVIFLRHPDRGLKPDAEFKNELRQIFKSYQPDILFTFDIDKEGYIYHHSDHEAAGIASHAVAPEFKSIKSIYQIHTSAPNTIVDVTDAADIKGQALAAHAFGRGDNNGAFKFLRVLLTFFAFFGRNEGRSRGLDNSYEKSLGFKYSENFRVIDNVAK